MSEERMIRVDEEGVNTLHNEFGVYIKWESLEPVAPKDWKPECYEEWCDMEHNIRKPGHGTCCTCQDCGYDYDNCVCNYFTEPCISCPYRKKRE